MEGWWLEPHPFGPMKVTDHPQMAKRELPRHTIATLSLFVSSISGLFVVAWEWGRGDGFALFQRKQGEHFFSFFCFSHLLSLGSLSLGVRPPVGPCSMHPRLLHNSSSSSSSMMPASSDHRHPKTRRFLSLLQPCCSRSFILKKSIGLCSQAPSALALLPLRLEILPNP